MSRTLAAAVLFSVAVPAFADPKEHPIVTLVRTKLKDPDRPFTATVAWRVKAGGEAAFEAAFRPCVAGTRAEPGCLAYFLDRDPDDPAVFVVYQRYKGIKAYEDHARTPHVLETLARIDPLTDGKPVVKVFTPAGE